jgi:hypothetical protein
VCLHHIILIPSPTPFTSTRSSIFKKSTNSYSSLLFWLHGQEATPQAGADLLLTGCEPEPWRHAGRQDKLLYSATVRGEPRAEALCCIRREGRSSSAMPPLSHSEGGAGEPRRMVLVELLCSVVGASRPWQVPVEMLPSRAHTTRFCRKRMLQAYGSSVPSVLCACCQCLLCML